MRFVLPVILLFVIGCNQAHTAKTVATHTAVTARNMIKSSGPQSDADRESSVFTFFDTLIDKRNIIIDSSWKQNMDSSSIEEGDGDFVYIGIPRAGDDPDSFVVFPFNDVKMTYTYIGSMYKQKFYFIINGKRMPADTIGADPFFHHIVRFTYFGKKYITLTAALRDYNGYGDRIHFNYFFDLSKPFRQDIYENSWCDVRDVMLYGDLNNDHQLDRLKFDGVSYPAELISDTQKNHMTIKAETYANGNWKPLKDKTGKPYYIHVTCNGYEDSLVIKDYHWMRKLK
ncbi:MAG: hypothetical protein H0X33_13670 [Taibaiella sp.]|nr:hypothetical protein [Taibaiella sp.]